MMRHQKSRFLLGVLGLALSTLPACGAGEPRQSDGAISGDEKETGSLSLALTASAGGHQYRFSRFEVLIYPEGIWLDSSGTAETFVSTPLSTGSHQIYLYDWALERDDGSGSFSHVDARLLSSSWMSFEILNGSTTSVAFQFETDGQIVTIGSGTLDVTGQVTERPPVCTVLGSDCGPGLWCPPTGLTGAPLACRAEGPLAIGEACRAPGDCAANSTCADLGAGAVCAALCDAASFGLDCPSGGICSAAAQDYGVCSP